MKKRIPNYWLLIPIIILTIYFIFRLINQSQMIWIFPTDAFANDFSGHIAKLFLLDKYGLWASVPEWYNGTYTMLKFYPAGWYLFSLPFLWVFKDVELAVFMSMIAMYLLGLLFFSLLGKSRSWSKTKIVALFLFFFANPISIGYFLRLGKMPEMFAWVVFILFFALLLKYLHKKIDTKFTILFILSYTLIFYIHTLAFVAASLLLIGFWLTRTSWPERIYLILQSLMVVVLTSVFWIPFLTILSSTKTGSLNALEWLILPGNLNDKIASFVLPVLFLVVGFYYLNNKTVREKIFFCVPLIFSFLILTRLAIFIPFFNRASPDTYHLLMIFLTAFMFLDVDISNFPKKVNSILPYALPVLMILAVLLSLWLTPMFNGHNQKGKETIELFEIAESPLLIKSEPDAHSNALISYATIYHGTSTPLGWEPIDLTEEYWKNTLLPEKLIIQKRVDDLSTAMFVAKAKSIIVYGEHCKTLKESDLQEVKTLKESCLYEVKWQ